MSYKTEAYLITCLTNLHVGSGDTGYGVVDNLVQRDAITNVPTIHASSLKGALREYFSESEKLSTQTIDYVFGPDSKRSKGSKEGVGHYKFFGGDMLSYPVRGHESVFRRATAPFLLTDIDQKGKQLGISDLKKKYFGDPQPAQGRTLQPLHPLILSGSEKLEGYEATQGLAMQSNSSVGESPVLFADQDFLELIQRLPTIARNKLSNGKSENLWYEEIVPRESRFVFFVSKLLNPPSAIDITSFDTVLDNCVIQLGANGSIGYGYCSIQKMSNHGSNN